MGANGNHLHMPSDIDINRTELGQIVLAITSSSGDHPFKPKSALDLDTCITSLGLVDRFGRLGICLLDPTPDQSWPVIRNPTDFSRDSNPAG